MPQVPAYQGHGANLARESGGYPQARVGNSVVHSVPRYNALESFPGVDIHAGRRHQKYSEPLGVSMEGGANGWSFARKGC